MVTTRLGRHNRRRLAALGALGALALAGCGGGGEDDAAAGDLIVVEDGGAGGANDNDDTGSGAAAIDEAGSSETGSETGSEEATGAESGDASGDADGAPVDEEAAAREFAQCMRDNGIDEFPDPTVGADGSVDFGFGPVAGGAGGGGGGNGLGQDPDFRPAIETCGELLEGAGFLPGGGDRTEINDQLLEVAECLREQGLDVDDPNLDAANGAPQPGAGGVFGGDFDPNDPVVAAALEACQGIFTAIEEGA
jgi:hypothetical protein